MTNAFFAVLNASVAACWLIAAVLLLRFVLRKSAPKWVVCLLWGVVALRLVMPFSIQSPFGLVPQSAASVSETAFQANVSPAVESDRASNSGGTGAAAAPHTAAPSAPYEAADQPAPAAPGDTAAPSTPATPAAPAIPAADQTVPAAPAAAAPSRGAGFYLAAVWIAGVAAMLAYALVNYLLLRRRMAASVLYMAGVRQSEKVRSPFVLGLFRPTVYLPFGLDPSTESHVLTHERAHIARGDHWLKFLWFAVLSVHWFNPLAWLSFVLLCGDIEYACDERVLRDMPHNERQSYAGALLALGVHSRRIAACPVAFGETNVKNRVKRVFSFKKPAVWLIVIILVASAVLTACFATVRGEKSGGTDNSVESGTETSKDPQTETSNTTEAVRVKLLRPVRSTGYPGIESVYSYNEYGELSAVKRSDKSESRYEYDNGQLVTGSTNTDGTVHEFSRSPDGSYTRSYTLAGVAYVGYYNEYGDLLKKTADGETVTECFYDENGYLTESRSYYNGELIEYEKETYNEYGRLVEREISPYGGRVQIRRYEYNSAMMPVRMTVDGNTFVEWEYGYIDCIYEPSRCYDLDMVLFEPNLITGEKLKHLMFSGAAPVFEGDSQPYEDHSLSESGSQETDQKNKNGKLFVDGKEIEYVCVINKEKREAELPLLTIAEQLGADIEWLSDTKVCISYDGHKEELDTNEEGFGWYPPPGTSGAVRKVEEHEIIMDSTSVSALIGYWFHVAINVDYQENTVNVVSSPTDREGDFDSDEPLPFSWADTESYYKDTEDPGIIRRGFVNTVASAIGSPSEAVRLALNEHKLQHDETYGVYYDKDADVWKVSFSNISPSVAGGCVDVYLSGNGITLLIIAGE